MSSSSPSSHETREYYADFIQPFLIDHSSIRGRFVRLDATLNAILSAHNYPLPVAALLAEQLVLTALLSATLRDEGILTVQAKGNGAIHNMVTDTVAGGTMRGYVDYNAAEVGALTSHTHHSLAQLMGTGYLAVTLDQGGNEDRYQGIVDLHEHSLADTFRNYFLQSQQGQIALHVTVVPPDKDSENWIAGGIIVERMPHEGGKESELSPEEHDELWQRTKIFMHTLRDEEITDTRITPQNLLYRLFNEDGVWVYKLQNLTAGCRCSRERIERALYSIAEADLRSTFNEQGTITIHCEFCNKREAFTESDIDRLYS